MTAFELALDETDVYLVDSLGIVRVPKEGGSPTLIYRGFLAHLTVDADAVYWTESAANHAVYAMNKQSLVVTKLADDLDDAGAIAADGDMATAFAMGTTPKTTPSKFVYWVDEKTGAVRRLAAGGVPETVMPGGVGVFSVRIDQERVYWTSEQPFSIRSQSIRGGDLKTVEASASVLDFALDANDAVFENALEVGRFSKPGGASVNVASGAATRVAADGASLYWTAHESCEVRSLDKASNTIRVIAANQARPSALGTDATHAYWTNIVDHTVMRAPK